MRIDKKNLAAPAQGCAAYWNKIQILSKTWVQSDFFTRPVRYIWDIRSIKTSGSTSSLISGQLHSKQLMENNESQKLRQNCISGVMSTSFCKHFATTASCKYWRSRPTSLIQSWLASLGQSTMINLFITFFFCHILFVIRKTDVQKHWFLKNKNSEKALMMIQS